MFLSLQRVNFPRVYSAGITAWDVIELMTVRIISVGLLSSEKSKPDRNAAIARSVTMSRSGASLLQISSNSISSTSWNRESFAVSGCTQDCAWSSVTVIRLLELKSALTRCKSFVGNPFPVHFVRGSNRASSFAL